MFKTLAVKNLELYNFRNFDQLELTFKPLPVVITGDNGVGKTNILEAISFISPGKGLRAAKLHEINNLNSHTNWQLHSTIQGVNGLLDITLSNTSDDTINTSKELLINNKKASSKSELSQIFSLLWLTPQMDNLFLGTSSDRRKFFDRIVFAFYPHHASVTNEYNHYLKERNKVLLLPQTDETWLNILEQKIVETGLKIAEARIQTINILNENCCHLKGKFPRANMAIEGEIETWFKSDPELATITYLAALKANRKMDMYSKRTNIGIHKSDFLVSNLEQQKEARICSTGEQKSLLISIILSYAKAKITHTEIAPVLLFDEITVHLDSFKKNHLFDELFALKCQFFITNVTSDDFTDLGNSVQHIAMDKTGVVLQS
jgi:DNA replication and repair protein RecF